MTTYRKLRLGINGRTVKAEIIDSDLLDSWKFWAAENTGRFFHLGTAYDVCHSDDVYDIYDVDPDDDAPTGGCTGYIAILWDSDQG